MVLRPAVTFIVGFAGVVDGFLEEKCRKSVIARFDGTFAVPPENVIVCAEAVVNVVTAKVTDANGVDIGMAVDIFFEAFEVLPPVGVGVCDIVVAVFWSADKQIEIGHVIGVCVCNDCDEKECKNHGGLRDAFFDAGNGDFFVCIDTNFCAENVEEWHHGEEMAEADREIAGDGNIAV